MASQGPSRREYSLSEAIELVMEEGSDVEEDDFIESEEGEMEMDFEEEYVPMNDEIDNGSESDSDHVYDAPTVIDSDESDRDIEIDFGDLEPPAADQMMFDNGGDDEWMRDWCMSLQNFPMSAPFTGNPGLHLPEGFSDTPTPLDFYQLFFTEDVLKSWKVETNRYAATVCRLKRQGGNLSPRSLYNLWKPVTMDEMRWFLAILIHMGLVKKPRIEDYWSTHPAMATAFASRLMKMPSLSRGDKRDMIRCSSCGLFLIT